MNSLKTKVCLLTKKKFNKFKKDQFLFFRFADKIKVTRSILNRNLIYVTIGDVKMEVDVTGKKADIRYTSTTPKFYEKRAVKK